MKKRFISLLMSAVMVLGLAACGRSTPAASSDVSASGDFSVSTPDPGPVVNVMAISGPTGVGATKMMGDNPQYNFTLVAGNDAVAPALAKGEVDIACIATNLAATLYNRDIDITVLAANTLGVLYILEKGNTVTDVASLRGKTIYSMGQAANPEYILDHVLTQNGLDPDKDVNIQFMTPQEVIAKMKQSSDGVCMLAVPAATNLLVGDTGIRQALDLSAEWDKVSDSSLVMGCVVVRNDFMEQHPELVEQFMTDYEASIAYMSDPANLAEAAELVAQYGITANADIAAKAIPQCNLTFLTGEEMRGAIQAYFDILFTADPASIGGGNPDDGFYYVP